MLKNDFFGLPNVKCLHLMGFGELARSTALVRSFILSLMNLSCVLPLRTGAPKRIMFSLLTWIKSLNVVSVLISTMMISRLSALS